MAPGKPLVGSLWRSFCTPFHFGPNRLEHLLSIRPHPFKVHRAFGKERVPEQGIHVPIVVARGREASADLWRRVDVDKWPSRTHKRWMPDDEPATDLQKEKLAFFGCSWDGDITKQQASEALDQCMKGLPDREREWSNRPATPAQLDRLVELDADRDDDSPLTYRQAKGLIEESASLEEEIAEVQDGADEALAEYEYPDFKDLYPWLNRSLYTKALAHHKATGRRPNSWSSIQSALEETFPERFPQKTQPPPLRP